MRVDDVRDAVRSLEARLDRRFDGVDRRFDQIDQRFLIVEQRFVAIELRLTGLDNKFMWLGGTMVAGFVTLAGLILRQ